MDIPRNILEACVTPQQLTSMINIEDGSSSIERFIFIMDRRLAYVSGLAISAFCIEGTCFFANTFVHRVGKIYHLSHVRLW